MRATDFLEKQASRASYRDDGSLGNRMRDAGSGVVGDGHRWTLVARRIGISVVAAAGSNSSDTSLPVAPADTCSVLAEPRRLDE